MVSELDESTSQLLSEVIPGSVIFFDSSGKINNVFGQFSREDLIQDRDQELESINSIFGVSDPEQLLELCKRPANTEVKSQNIDIDGKTTSTKSATTTINPIQDQINFPFEELSLRFIQVNLFYKSSNSGESLSGGVFFLRLAEPSEDAELYLKERAMEAASEGITIARAGEEDNPLIYVNKGFVDMTGYERETVLGRDCRFLQGPDTSEETIEKIREGLKNDKPTVTEIVNYRKSGEKFYNRLSITPVPNDKGEITHYIGIQKDITKLKEQQKELQQAEKLAAVGKMAAGVMHEINNPNAVIKGNVEFLMHAWEKIMDAVSSQQDEFDENLQFYVDETEKTLREIIHSSRRIEKIVEKVEFFTRRKTRDDYSPINPIKPIRTCLKNLRPEELNIVNYDMDEFPDDENLLLYGDTFELQQIVQNLLENALQAVQDTNDPEISVEVDIDDEELVIQIQDNGVGIGEEHRDKIYDPFYTTKSPGEGTGLGMSIVRGIVERMNGTINFTTQEGVGTTFTVKFPLYYELLEE